MLDRRSEERAVTGSMALLSTLSAAVDVVGAMRERRLGRDPSEQQAPEVVMPPLFAELRKLDDHLIALRAGLVAAERESLGRVVLVRQMNTLILLGRLHRVLHGIHQRLMSLYPQISEDLVEEARSLYRACDELIEREDVSAEVLGAFIDETCIFAGATRREATRIQSAE